jgi:hypothetical protein
MFKRIAILTALATTASSAAYAQPRVFGRADVDVTIRADGDRRYEGDRYDRNDRPRAYDRNHRRRDRAGTPLGTQMSGYQEIWLRGQHQPFRRLVIQGDRGAPFIGAVSVEYQDGTGTALKLNQRLRRGEAHAIRVGNRAIKRIVINTMQTNVGEYSVIGV